MKNNVKKLLASLLAITIVLPLFPPVGLAVEEVPEVKAISTAEELHNFIVANPSGNFILSNDIDLESYNGGVWIPLEFRGQLDGSGYVIKNLNIPKDQNLQYAGLFSKINNAVISNLSIQVSGNGVVAGNKSSAATVSAGIMAGISSGNTEIRDCTIQGNVISTMSGSSNITSELYTSAGGLVGSTETGSTLMLGNISVDDVTVISQSRGNDYYAGGLIGRALGKTVIENACVRGNISEIWGGEYTGGYRWSFPNIGGLIGACNADVSIKNANSYCELKAAANVGGIIGCIQYHTDPLTVCIEDCSVQMDDIETYVNGAGLVGSGSDVNLYVKNCKIINEFVEDKYGKLDVKQTLVKELIITGASVAAEEVLNDWLNVDSAPEILAVRSYAGLAAMNYWVQRREIESIKDYGATKSDIDAFRTMHSIYVASLIKFGESLKKIKLSDVNKAKLEEFLAEIKSKNSWDFYIQDCLNEANSLREHLKSQLAYEERDGKAYITGFIGVTSPYAMVYAADNESNTTLNDIVSIKDWLYIPDEVDGYEVAGIAPGAFAGDEEIETVFIDAPIENVGQGAFENCSRLNLVYFMQGVQRIEDNAFSGAAISVLSLPENVEYIGENAFSGCDFLEHVAVQSKDVEIGNGAFQGSNTTLYTGLPNSTIQEYADNNGGEFETTSGNVVELSIVSMPVNTEVLVGHEINTEGLALKAKYADGSEKTIEQGYLAYCDTKVEGETTATVHFGSKTVSYAVTVNAMSPSNTPAIDIDFLTETLLVGNEAEYSTDGGSVWNDCEAKMPAVAFGWDGTSDVTIQFRTKGSDDFLPSETVERVIPARPAIPIDLKGVNETVSGKHDGQILGVSTAMEYRAAGTERWITCRGDMIGELAPGDYHVRMKATSDAFAGSLAAVVIDEGIRNTDTPTSGGNSEGESPSGGGSSNESTSYTLTATAGQGGTISPEGKVRVIRNRSQSFTITPEEGYEIEAVFVDGKNVGKISSYEFEKVTKAHTITVVFKRLDNAPEAAFSADWNLFADVKSSDWFYNSVKYVCEAGLMTGTSGSYFSPTINTTRGMAVTILWRLDGMPSVQGAIGFHDVQLGTYYANAVAWSRSVGIIAGYGDGTFRPNDSITREQLATMLYRYATIKGYDVRCSADLTGYSDENLISGYAHEPLKWATAVGIINGTDWGGLYPGGYAIRSEVAAVLERFGRLIGH